MATKIPGFSPEQMADPAFVRQNAAAIRAAAKAAAEAEQAKLRSVEVLGFTAEQLADEDWLDEHWEELMLAARAHAAGQRGDPEAMGRALPPDPPLLLSDAKWVRENKAEILKAQREGRLRK